MEYPVIIIDSISNSKKSDDDDNNNNDKLIDNETKKDFVEFYCPDDKDVLNNFNNLKTPKSGNEDGDSGIHGSSEAFESTSPHNLTRSSTIRDEKSSSIIRSNSANSLIERKRSFSISFERSMRNRNYSIDTGKSTQQHLPMRTKSFKRENSYKLMIVDEIGQAVFIKSVNRQSIKSIATSKSIDDRKESNDSNFDINKAASFNNNTTNFWNHLCQIHILLIIMKFVLGISMTLFGCYLWKYSPSIYARDCGFWASSVLFGSGLLSLYYINQKLFFHKPIHHKLYSALAVTVSIFSIGVTMASSIYAGSHSNWLSFSAHHCILPSSLPNEQLITTNQNDQPYKFSTNKICCYNFPFSQSDSTLIQLRNQILVFADRSINITKNTEICGCLYEADPPNTFYISSQTFLKIYLQIRCQDLFSSIKDYFVLICSLMAVGSGCEIWFLYTLISHKFQFETTGSTTIINSSNSQFHIKKQPNSILNKRVKTGEITSFRPLPPPSPIFPHTFHKPIS